MATLNRRQGIPAWEVVLIVVVIAVVGRVSEIRRTRESTRLCAAKYQQAHNASDTAAVDNYQVVPPSPLRHGAIPAIICRKYRGPKK